MKKYIGTKTVEAIEMTLGEFVNTHNRNPYSDGVVRSPKSPGYLVKYEDGYESWSPKDVFDKAYKLAETPLDRMLIEGSELTTKLEKLQQFISSDKFKTLDEATRALLEAQENVMRAYQNVLNIRYAKMEGNNPKVESLSFGDAIALLKNGYALRRAGWNGKGMFVVKQIPCTIGEAVIPKMQSLPMSARDILMSRDNKEIHYSNQMLIVKPDGTADSWVPSVSDVFAEDWELVETENK